MFHLQRCCSVLCLVFSLIVIVPNETYSSSNIRMLLTTNIPKRITRNVHFDEVNVHLVLPRLKLPQTNCTPPEWLTKVEDTTTFTPTTQRTTTTTQKTTTKTPLTTSATTNSTLTCPKGFVLVEECFYFSPNKASWHNALKTCMDFKSDFAYPVTHTAVETYLMSIDKEKSNWWVGGTDEGHEGKWVWIHGKSPFYLSQWASGQPSNLTNENCMYVMGNDDYMWADGPCSMELKFICQVIPTSITRT